MGILGWLFLSGDERSLHQAILDGETKKAKAVLARRPRVATTAYNRERDTALHVAALADSCEIAEVLRGHNADVNARNRVGITPLHKAAAMGSVEMVDWLVKNGADVNAKGGFGWTPLHSLLFALDKMNLARLAMAGRQDLVVMMHASAPVNLLYLVQHGADVNASDGLGLVERPLKVATHLGQKDLADLLRARGATE